ncbi:MAG: hypothetical protein H6Q85_3200 [candidate division NC10 bacterium]|nr:hypothetical protein [candidate division NC10 bacterium]
MTSARPACRPPVSAQGAWRHAAAPGRLGASCALDLPPPCGALSLPAQVVWCTVVGRKRKLGGDSHLVARSGLRFTTLTAVQRAALADSLRHLATTVQPDGHRRTA